MADLERLEFWSDVMVGGGERLALVPDALSVRERVNIDGTSTLTLELPLDSPALTPIGYTPTSTAAEPRGVVRLVTSDGAFVERRIRDFTQLDSGGEYRAQIVADSLLQDLAVGGLISRSDPLGGVTFNFEALTLTPLQHVQYALNAMVEGGRNYWAAGTLDVSTPVTIVYDRDTPLSGLRKLVAALPGTPVELQVRFDLARQRYVIDLVRQIGLAAPLVLAHAGVSLREMSLTRSLANVITRVYAFGTSDPDYGRATMAQNAYIASTVLPQADGTFRVVLTDPAGGPGPIAFDGQFVGGFYLVPVGNRNAAILTIESSDALSGTLGTRRTFSTGNVPVGLLYRIAFWPLGNPQRTGGHVTFLDHPIYGTPSGTLGVTAGYVDRPDVDGALNYVPNPLMRLWPAGQRTPTGMTVSPGITVTRETDPAFWRSGGQAAHILLPTPELGQATITTVTEIGTGDFISFFVDMLTLQNRIEVLFTVTLLTPVPAGGMPNPRVTFPVSSITYPRDLWMLDASWDPSVKPPPDLRNVQTGVWERLGIAAAHDAKTYPATTVIITVMAADFSGGPLEFVWDAAQVTRGLNQRELIEGSGANVLLSAANDKLRDYAAPATSLSVNLLDLQALDEDTFPYDEFVLGGRVEVRHERLQQSITTRVLGWERDWLARENLSVTIGNTPQDITRVLTLRGPDARPGQVVGGLR